MDKNTLENILDYKIKNLEPTFRDELLKNLLDDVDITRLKNKQAAVTLIRKRLNINTSVSVNTSRYYVLRGWCENVSKFKAIEHNAKIKRPDSVYKWQSWLSKINPSTNIEYTEDEAKYEVASRRPTNKEYWLVRYDEDDATFKWKEYQQTQSKKSNAIHYKGRIPTQIQYWENRINPSSGLLYTESESRYMVKERQRTTGIFSFIQRNDSVQGGVRAYIDSINNPDKESLLAFLSTDIANLTTVDEVKLKLETYKLIKNYASKESLRYFGPIFDVLRNKYEILIGAYGSKEMWLSTEDGRFRYDFAIPSHNLIIEYDGSGHYRYKGYNKFEEICERDTKKAKIAEECGYNIHRISMHNQTPNEMRIELLRILANAGIVVPLEELSTHHGYKNIKRIINEANNRTTI